VFRFEKLAGWQKSVAFADLVYETSGRFPDNERFGLTSQIRRAAVSIGSNIAEGSARSDPDFARFIGCASGSLYEVVTQAYVARRRGFLSEAEFGQLYAASDEIARMLSGLRGSLGDPTA
jgi:four helix bundle protein